MSIIKVGAIQTPSGVEVYTAKAWVNFNGTATPVTIRASGNIGSITDNGNGDYTTNFTNAISDVNYSAIGSTTIGAGTTNSSTVSPLTLATSSCRTKNLRGPTTTGNSDDTDPMCIAFFR